MSKACIDRSDSLIFQHKRRPRVIGFTYASSEVPFRSTESQTFYRSIMTADDSIKCRCANSGMTGQVDGFQNRGVCLQAFPSFLPHPLSVLLLVPFFAPSLTLVARALLLNRTETLATQATFCSVVCCELFFQWLLLERFWHLQGSFQGALGLDNCVRYRCNRPRLYLTEEHSIRWKFCLVNHKLFHLACVACACERSKVKGKGIRAPAIFHLIFSEHRRFDLSFHPFEDQRKLTACHSIQKCTKKLFRNSFGWVEERLMQFWAK